MKIAFITSFPPSRHALCEYGFHVAEQLRRESSIELTILGDYVPATAAELPDYNVVRCWGFGKVGNARNAAAGHSQSQAGCGVVQPGLCQLWR